MINALKKLESLALLRLYQEVEAFAISGCMNELLSTHPPLSKRIEALESNSSSSLIIALVTLLNLLH